MCPDRCMGLLGIGHVQRDRTDLCARACHEVTELLGMARRRNLPLAVLQDGLGERASEAAGTSGNEPDF